jgi:general secretion pathway protein A
MHSYINHRLEVAGAASGNLIPADALDLIYRYTGGIPRLINTLCDTALLCAFADNKPAATIDDVTAAITELDWDEHESNTGVYEQLQQIANRRPGTESHVMQIEVRKNGETESIHTFPPGRVIVGRSPDNEIYIKSKFVSRHHLQLVCDAEGCALEDLNSTNGVFIGEAQVKKRELESGDIISLGVHELVYTAIGSGTHDKADAEDDFEDTYDEILPVIHENSMDQEQG